MISRMMFSRAPAATILIRLMVGGIFVLEGVQKFLYPGDLGVGRFVKIGIPAPEVMAPFVGGVEIVCGVMLLAGLLTRLAAIPLLIAARRSASCRTAAYSVESRRLHRI